MFKFSQRIYCMYVKFKYTALKSTWHLPIRYGRTIPALGIISLFTKKKDTGSKTNPLTTIITKADELFEDEDYLEAYNLLSSYKNDNNIEVRWRICRALYKMSRTDIFSKSDKDSMIKEAYELICETEKLNGDNGDVYKWLAILLDAKLHLDNKFTKFEDNIKVKDHLMTAYKLKPDDYTILYMLGEWHYKFCTMNWLQKKIATLFYPNAPVGTYEDALNYFLKAEEIKPRFLLANTYMLGKLSYHMGNMYRAHYYLTIAAQMTPSTDKEEKYVQSAKQLIVKLKHFDVSDDAL